MTELNRYHIFVSSALRNSGTSSEFSISVNPPLTKQHPYNYFVAQIASVELPYSWDQVNSSNNTLQFSYNMGSGFTNYTCTITEGNYNILQLITALTNAIDSVIPAHTWTWNITYSQTTGKVTFGIALVPPLPTIMLNINFPANTFLARMFGCLSSSNIIFGYSSSSYQTASGSTNVNVNPISSIFIRSTNLAQIKNQENLVAGYTQDVSDILCKIQVLTPPKTWVMYNGELGLSAKLTNPIIDKIDVYLSDNYSFSLNLKNNDWTFRITFIEYRPVDLGDAYLQTKHLNGSAGDEGVRSLTASLNAKQARATKEETARQRVDEEVKNEEVKNEEVKTRRFQK